MAKYKPNLDCALKGLKGRRKDWNCGEDWDW